MFLLFGFYQSIIPIYYPGLTAVIIKHFRILDQFQ